MCICARDCYSARKKKEILPFATSWMNQEDIRLNERGQKEKEKKNSRNFMKQRAE